MEYVLVLVFMINGELQFNTQALPAFFNTQQECEQVRLMIDSKARLNSPYPYHLSCYSIEAKGSDM